MYPVVRLGKTVFHVVLGKEAAQFILGDAKLIGKGFIKNGAGIQVVEIRKDALLGHRRMPVSIPLTQVLVVL